jgi:phospholipid/cholesterol/gamma-HCH transport system permease protein
MTMQKRKPTNADTPTCELHDDVLYLRGQWELTQYHAMVAALNAVKGVGATLALDGQDLVTLDTAGSILIKKFATSHGIACQDMAFQHMRDDYTIFIREIWARSHPPQLRKQKHYTMLGRFMDWVGKVSTIIARETANMLSFTGQVVYAISRCISQPSEFRFRSLVRHMDEAGVRAIPIISLLAFLISIVLGYQGATQLKMFGAEVFTIDLTAISILREMGVLLTAIMVAGRSGSAFATEIGVMKLRDEVDALKTIGLNPFQLLVLPRVLSLIIMMPVLTFIADMFGLLGTFLMTNLLLDIPLDIFLERCANTVELNTFLVGIAKAPVFGLLIGLVGTYQGMQVKGSAESVGKLTTISVVQSIFMVIFANALFSILFAEFGL